MGKNYNSPELELLTVTNIDIINTSNKAPAINGGTQGGEAVLPEISW